MFLKVLFREIHKEFKSGLLTGAFIVTLFNFKVMQKQLGAALTFNGRYSDTNFSYSRKEEEEDDMNWNAKMGCQSNNR